MRLQLDHQQRLNLIALMGMQKGTVSEIRVYWKLQDRLEMDDAEKMAIGYQTITRNGMEAVQWDTTKSLPLREFEISDSECQVLKRVVEGFPEFQTGTDRKWIEPLLDQLPNEVPVAVPAAG